MIDDHSELSSFCFVVSRWVRFRQGCEVSVVRCFSNLSSSHYSMCWCVCRSARVFVCACICAVRVCMLRHVCRARLCEISSRFSPLCGSWGSNTIVRVQVLLLLESSPPPPPFSDMKLTLRDLGTLLYAGCSGSLTSYVSSPLFPMYILV